MNRTARSAFTLIELLLVLVIIAVLASVMVPVYTKQVDISRYRATLADIGHLKSALAAFQIDNGRFPSTEEGLGALTSRPTDLATTWNGPYLEQITPDKWGTPYVYINPDPEDASYYKLFSCGKDRTPYTTDDITQYTIADGSAPQ